MGFWDFIAPGHKQAMDDADEAIDDTLTPGSAYYNSGDYLGQHDAAILQGAAALGANPVAAANTYAMDQDASALGALGKTFRDMQAHGGQLEAAAAAQQGADLANSGTAALKQNARAAANNVIGAGTSERSMAAQGANASQASILANELKKQVYAAAVTHANATAAMQGQALQNQAQNTQYDIDRGLQQGAASARVDQNAAHQQGQQQAFNNTMTTLQTGLGIASQGVSTGISAATAGSIPGVSKVAVASPYRSAASLALPGPELTSYVNPITGSTQQSSVPSDLTSWGSWLYDTSTLAS